MREFQKEFCDCWRQLPNKVFFLGLLLAWAAVFQFLGNSTFGYFNTNSLFKWTYWTYTVVDGDDGHGLLIPFVVGFLFWLKRKELLQIPVDIWWPALLLLLFSIVLHLFGYLVQQPRISIVAFFLGAYSLIGLAWGPRLLKSTLFPFVLFAFCVPVGSLEFMTNVTLPLRLLAVSISSWIVNELLGFGVIRHGTQLFDSTGNYSYDVNAACSGIRSLISLFVLMTVYGVIAFKSRARRLALVIASIPFAIACNVLRLLSVIIAAELFGQKAGNVVHDWSGFFTYALAVAFMLFISRFGGEETPRGLLEAKTV
ncbi:MAG: hypothetical protein JWM68_5301 [Verrucomicrobiales bacterium]|nr:hypothetical protein [Verrucomicrobiales bacterium]